MRSCIRPSKLAAFATALATLAGVSMAAAQSPPAPAHLQAALELVQSVAPENTSYRHHEGSVQWRGDGGQASSVCHTDCSGLVNALLKRSYGLSDDNLRQWFHARRPLARHYHAAIERKEGFQPIGAVQAIQPGDLLAVRNEHSEKGEDTGHVMLVAQAPQERKATAPLAAGTRQWDVEVIDETSSAHGLTDTRHQADGQKRGGVGSGVIRLYSDAAGNVVGYTWSTARKSKFQSPSSRPMLIGRIDPRFVQGLKTGRP